MTSATQASERGAERRGAVLEMVGQLLADGQAQDRQARQVLAVVKQLLARNAELEQRLSSGSYQSSEGISSQQLLLLIDALPQGGELAETDDKLRLASAIDASRFEEERLTPEPKPRRRCVGHCPTICAAWTIRSRCLPSSVPARAAAKSESASATTRPRWWSSSRRK